MIDISGKVDVEDMPLCPLCDNAILKGEFAAVVACEGAIGLAHEDCAEDEDD